MCCRTICTWYLSCWKGGSFFKFLLKNHSQRRKLGGQKSLFLVFVNLFFNFQKHLQPEDMSLVKSALTYGLILLNFHNIGLSIQCVNSTTVSGNQYIFIFVDNPNSQSLTCMLAKPLHLYHNNFNYLSACWTSLC